MEDGNITLDWSIQPLPQKGPIWLVRYCSGMCTLGMSFHKCWAYSDVRLKTMQNRHPFEKAVKIYN
jgi:hypothetical protein